MKFIDGAPDKAGDELVRRPLEHLEWRADLSDDAVLEHHDLVGEGHRLDLVVGDEDHRGAKLALQPLDLDAGLVAQLGVEVGERFVEQEHFRLAHHGAADGNALSLPARELRRPPVHVGIEAEHGRRLAAAAVDLGFAARR